MVLLSKPDIDRLMGNQILVVDDEAGCREGLRRLLEAWGYEAETAASGEEALARMKAGQSSAVITDLVMPGIDGLEAVRNVPAQLTGQTAMPGLT